MEEIHYPPKPIQQPRIPLWVPVIWPSKKSLQRALKCDGLLPEKRDPDEQPVDVTPDDVREIMSYVSENRTLTTPFDVVVSGESSGLDNAQLKDKILPWLEAGATWWVEGFRDKSEEMVTNRIQQGPAILR